MEARTTFRAQLQAVRDAWVRFVVTLLGLGTVIAVAMVILWPWGYAQAVERLMLPTYEAPFGFRGGRVSVEVDGRSADAYAIMEVVSGGRLERAGLRSRDIPVAHHGGPTAFLAALRRARAGEAGEFAVLAAADWGDWSKRREVVVR